MDQEINSGGPYIGKGVGTGGGDFVGRDEIIINEQDPSDLLAAMRAQLNRVEDNFNWKMALIERDVANIKLQVLILVIVTTLLFLAFTFVLVISVVNLERHSELLPALELLSKAH